MDLIEIDEFKLMIILSEVYVDVLENNIYELFELIDYKSN